MQLYYSPSVAALGGTTDDAKALNVPGAAVGNLVIDNVFYVARDAAEFAQGGGGMSVSGLGHQFFEISPNAGSLDTFVTAPRDTKWGLSFTVDYAHLDFGGSVDLDYDIVMGSVALGYAVSDDFTLLGGAILEYGDGSSDAIQSDIDNIGYGAFVGGIYEIDENWTFTAIGAIEQIDFDTKRANDTIRGEYDAYRYMAAFEVDYYDVTGPWGWRVGAGARYINQLSTSYQEQGPGGVLVPSVRDETLTLTARGKLGYSFENGMTPYGELGFEYDIVDDVTTAGGQATVSNGLSDFSVQPRFGIEWAYDSDVRFLAESGFDVSGDGFDAFTLRLNAQIRF